MLITSLTMTVTWGMDLDLTMDNDVRKRCIESKKAAVLSETKAPFNIVATNSQWSSMCGYFPEEALGCSPKDLLQGELTDSNKAKRFAEQLTADGHARTTLVNYSKFGRAFVHTISSELVMDTKNGASCARPANRPSKPHRCQFLA